MLLFHKEELRELPQALIDRIKKWNDEDIEIDDTGLTAQQITRITNFITKRGYQVV